MNWFDTSGLTSLAKTALKEAQKTLDKALDIQDDDEEEEAEAASPSDSNQQSPAPGPSKPKESKDFFSSWGLTVSAESASDEAVAEKPVVTESPSKSTQKSMWGSFAGSFFDNPKEECTVVQPPKAKSMNVIADAKYGSQDDLFSKSQLVMSDADSSSKSPKDNDRRGSSRSNQLSLVSSRNSSDSVEVLSQSMKTTPDSEVSVLTMSHSSSFGHKLNSESVEILPDSLVSPSSIECLGFDSSSDKNSSSSVTSVTDKKSTPVGDKIETADSVSLVPDDDEDTISYNSISECTAPTVLDTDDKVSSFPKVIRTEPQRKIDKEFVHIDSTLMSQKMQLSENSSDGGSWSDRTLNAEDSINYEGTEEQKKEHEDIFMEKLSDSSSFYNVNVSSSQMRHSESAVFVDVDQHCQESSESHKDESSKERISPTSSDSKSESLVKIGSDRTSGHTSGDELETATSSDIEIIPSPNGDNGQSFRNSPMKYALKSKLDGNTSPSLVDLVLGKSLASKIRGHNRELSEVSIQSNTSDESQGSENDRLMRRLCEMAEVLEARENRLMEVSRSNADLTDSNAELRVQLETLRARNEAGEGIIAEDYTQRMSALEKKFQQAIKEKDQLRKQLDSIKTDSGRKTSSEFENAVKEKDDMIAQLQEEGEKLSKQQLQHSNIIKKLRAKEKDNEQVIKGLRDKVVELTGELERVKRALSAREEVEVNQIEAVYRLTTHNKRLEEELVETKSTLDDTTQRLESSRTSLEATRKELTELQRTSSELERRRGVNTRLASERDRLEKECERLRQEVTQLRTEMVAEQNRYMSRERSLRAELREAVERAESVEWRDRGAETEAGGAALLQQVASLQTVLLDKERAHHQATAGLKRHLAEAQSSLATAMERERVTREENVALQERLAAAEGLLTDYREKLDGATVQCQQSMDAVKALQDAVASKTRELERLKEEYETKTSQLQSRVSEMERLLSARTEALDVEKKRNAILQEQLYSGSTGVTAGDPSPPHSVISDSLSNSLWQHEDGSPSAFCLEETLSQLTRKEGEVRALAALVTQLRGETDAVRRHAAQLQAELDELRTVQEQYDALLQMYGEKEEQLQEVKLDLSDVTALYKAQLDELVALRGAAGKK